MDGKAHLAKAIRKLRSSANQWLLRFVRLVFRLAGGYHQSEHHELIWAAEVLAEVEAAELRLQVLHMNQRHRMLTRMLNEELRAYDHSKGLPTTVQPS